jgi:chitinase
MTLIQTYGLSGVDLDFEINRPYRADEAKRYAELVAQLRRQLGDTAVISLATIIDTETLRSFGAANWKVIADNVSFVSMMCYDLVSSKSGSASGLASNLYVVPNAPPSLPNANMSCNKSIHYLITLGVPAHKIVLGIPAYAIAFGSVGLANDGLFQAVNPDERPAFDDMGKGLLRYSTVVTLNTQNFYAHDSQVAGVVNGVWLLNAKTQQFITYDNPDSVKAKMDYIVNNNLAGVMMWRIGQDVPIDNKQSLLRAVVKGAYKKTELGF